MTNHAHSDLGGSTAERWMHCPGSIRLNAAIPDPPPTPAALDGIRAHKIAELCLRSFEPTSDNYRGVEYFDGLGEPWRATGEMCDAVDLFLDTVYAQFAEGDELYSEVRLDLSSVYPGMFGTADAIIFKPRDNELHVFDFKYGAGVLVEAEDNVQTKYYALAALKQFQGIRKITCWIIQPRAPHHDGPVRSVTYSAVDLIDWEPELRAAAERTADPNAPLIVGRWCRFCKAADAMICEAFKSRAIDAASDAFGKIITPVAIESMSLEELGRRLDMLPALKIYVEKLEAYAYEQARAGRMPIGADGPYKWIAGRGRRVFNVSETEVLFHILEETGRNVAQRVCPSPAQLERMLGKDEYMRVVAPMVTRRYSSPKLVPATDKRPAITLDEVLTADRAGAFDVIGTETTD